MTPLIPHFYVVKLVFTGVYIIPSRNMKSQNFYLKTFSFW